MGGKSVDFWALGILTYMLVTLQTPFYSENRNELFEMILHEEIHWEDIQDNITSTCLSFLRCLLQKDISQRLGCGPDGIQELKKHIFFDGFDWKKLQSKKLKAPYK